MSGNKKYKGKDWLKLRYVIQRRTVEEIAEECGVHPLTIYRYLWGWGFIDKSKTDNPRKLKGKYNGKEIR